MMAARASLWVRVQYDVLRFVCLNGDIYDFFAAIVWWLFRNNLVRLYLREISLGKFALLAK